MKFSRYPLLEKLVSLDSPTGFTEEAALFICETLEGYGLKPHTTRKGSVRCALGENPVLALTAHFDTLGAMVSGVNADGTLAFAPVASLPLTSAEGEYVQVISAGGARIQGTLLLNNPSSHANGKRETTERSPKTMHIRLDEEVFSKEDVHTLGIRVGDFIAFEPRFREFDNGYIKSRFMDNKAGCYVLFEVARRLGEQHKKYPIELHFSNYEEVGHGGSTGYAPSVEDLLVVDMGVVGDPCQGTETACSICAQDSMGPYDYRFRSELVALAERRGIPYRLDVYPHYSSDGLAALEAGYDFRVALIGPGVSASHGVERTHKKGIEATIDLCLAYIETHVAHP